MIRFATPLLCAGVLTAPAIAAEVRIETSGPVVELRISETVQSAPDMAQITAGVITGAPTARAAMRQNAEKMDAVVAELRRMGIASKDIQTSNFNVSPQYRYDRPSEQQILTGYQVSNSVAVRLRDLDRIGETLDTLVTVGANNISGPHFTLEDNEDVKAEARSRAYARGLEMARDYARLAGYSNVRLLEVSESVQSSGARPQAVMMRADAMEANVATPIEAGEVGTSVSISVKYEMTAPR